jgi:hypothetical protein
MLEKEFKYYLKHQKELVKKYNGKIIVIVNNKVNNKVINKYDNKKDAYLDSNKKFKPGTFLIIECTPGKDSYTIHQRSRIITAS